MINRNVWNDFDVSHETDVFDVIVYGISAVLLHIYVAVCYRVHNTVDYVPIFQPITR